MFDRFFSSSNVIWTAMGKIFDLFVLNTLLLICSIPVITIGPSLTAFFYVLISMIRGEERSISKDFFYSFRRNFGQGVRLGFPLTALLVFLYVDILLARSSGTGVWTFFMVFFSVIFLFVLSTVLYVFPVLAKFEKSNREILAWSFTLSLKNAGRTLLILLMLVIGWWLLHLLPGLLFILFGLEGLMIAGQMAVILGPWLPSQAVAASDDSSAVEVIE